MKNKPKVEFDTSQLGEMSPDQVAEHNAKSRASANPLVRGMMDEVDAAIDQENALMDAQFEGHAKLRAWAKELLGFEISMTQIEQLQKTISQAKSGTPIIYQGEALFKTAFGTVDRLDRYIFALERTIVDLTNRTSPAPKQVKDPFTELSSYGLIKLAVKRLFKRSK